LETPSIPSLEVLTSAPGSATFLPLDHDSRVSNTLVQFPDLILFTEPHYETYLFPSEGPIQEDLIQREFEAFVTSTLGIRFSTPWNLNSLFEVNSEVSLPLYEG